MIRHLAPLPLTRSLRQLDAATRARFGSAIGVNVVADDLAVYFEDRDAPTASAVAAWQSEVAAHVPTSPTPEEQDLTAQANDATLRQQAISALGTNRTYLGLTSPTNAQNAAQIKALTRQVQALIRLSTDRLEGTD